MYLELVSTTIIKVACDSDGRMRCDKLIEEIERTKMNSQIPFCVVATSGTTVRGAFDPVKEIAEICSDQDLWLHVDAAWGVRAFSAQSIAT